MGFPALLGVPTLALGIILLGLGILRQDGHGLHRDLQAGDVVIGTEGHVLPKEIRERAIGDEQTGHLVVLLVLGHGPTLPTRVVPEADVSEDQGHDGMGLETVLDRGPLADGLVPAGLLHVEDEVLEVVHLRLGTGIVPIPTSLDADVLGDVRPRQEGLSQLRPIRNPTPHGIHDGPHLVDPDDASTTVLRVPCLVVGTPDEGHPKGERKLLRSGRDDDVRIGDTLVVDLADHRLDVTPLGFPLRVTGGPCTQEDDEAAETPRVVVEEVGAPAEHLSHPWPQDGIHGRLVGRPIAVPREGRNPLSLGLGVDMYGSHADASYPSYASQDELKPPNR